MDTPSVAYRFDQFVLNLDRGCLQRAGADVELRPKAFEVLRHLVGRAGRLVSKSELVDTVWPNLAVSDDSLSQCILEIRRRLGDEDHRLIKTVPRRGYLFAGEVLVEPAPATALPIPVDATTAADGRSGGVLVFGAICVVLLGIGSFTAGTALNRIEYPWPTPLPTGAKTAIGQPIAAYPSGRPAITATIVPLPPGVESGWHSHPVPLIAYVLDGEVSVDYGSKGVRVYRRGEALLEAIDWPHTARNLGWRPASILVITLGEEGVTPSAPARAPDP